MDPRFTLKNASQDRSWTIGRRIVLTEVGESLGHPPARRTVPTLAVKGLQMAKRGAAQPHRLLEHRVEYRREVAGRGVDDLQHLGGRGLLRQRLARLGQQPRIFNRDDRWRPEILD